MPAVVAEASQEENVSGLEVESPLEWCLIAACRCIQVNIIFSWIDLELWAQQDVSGQVSSCRVGTCEHALRGQPHTRHYTVLDDTELHQEDTPQPRQSDSPKIKRTLSEPYGDSTSSS